MNVAEFEQWLAREIANTVRRDQNDPTKEVISWPIIEGRSGARDEARAFAKWARAQGYKAKAHYNFVRISGDDT